MSKGAEATLTFLISLTGLKRSKISPSERRTASQAVDIGNLILSSDLFGVLNRMPSLYGPLLVVCGPQISPLGYLSVNASEELDLLGPKRLC
jgi:hypothetical protein